MEIRIEQPLLVVVTHMACICWSSMGSHRTAMTQFDTTQNMYNAGVCQKNWKIVER